MFSLKKKWIGQAAPAEDLQRLRRPLLWTWWLFGGLLAAFSYCYYFIIIYGVANKRWCDVDDDDNDSDGDNDDDDDPWMMLFK